MSNVIIIISIIYIIGAIRALLTIPLEKIYVKKLNKKISKYRDIYVLLPALKEQKIVKTTIDWFRKIKYKGNIKFIIITTQKEEKEYREKGIKSLTTNAVVDDYLTVIKDDRFLHYHYMKTNGNKSSQMNYAIKKIIKDYNPNQDETYISVFDFDSEPELTTFDKLNQVAEFKNSPDAINQVPLSIKNYEEMSYKKPIMLLYSMNHMIRSCGIEKFRLLLSSLTNLNVPQYCMGACMHLKMSTLVRNGCFPLFVDDLTLGYRMSIRANTFAYLPAYNYSLIPNKLIDYMNSSTLIFKGVSTYLSEVKNDRSHLWGRIKVFFMGSANIIIFTLVPWLLIGYYLYSLLAINFNFAFFISLSIPYIWCISTYLIIKLYKIKDNKFNSILAILFSPIWFIFRPSGFLIYFKRLIISKITKKSITYKKTGR